MFNYYKIIKLFGYRIAEKMEILEKQEGGGGVGLGYCDLAFDMCLYCVIHSLRLLRRRLRRRKRRRC